MIAIEPPAVQAAIEEIVVGLFVRLVEGGRSHGEEISRPVERPRLGFAGGDVLVGPARGVRRKHRAGVHPRQDEEQEH